MGCIGRSRAWGETDQGLAHCAAVRGSLSSHSLGLLRRLLHGELRFPQLHDVRCMQ